MNNLGEKGSLMTLGTSFTTVPFEKASKEDFEAMQKRRDASEEFKQWIRLRYQPKKKTIFVSCVRKRHEMLVSFLETKDFP